MIVDHAIEQSDLFKSGAMCRIFIQPRDVSIPIGVLARQRTMPGKSLFEHVVATLIKRAHGAEILFKTLE